MSKIITICGSQTFCKEMESAQKHLQEKGFTVHAPGLLVTEEFYTEQNSREELLKMKPIWTKEHFERIKESDAILIMNLEKRGISGYFGSNTLMELSVAFFLNKELLLLNPFSEDHPLYEEIAGLDFRVLNGDLDSIT